ncbi:MAG: DUF389 domain-containing protein [Eubacteriales bacterium]|nr:DUF389 domain-containing protein [Eubacteriales bacterium]
MEISEKSQKRRRALKRYFASLFEIRSDMVSYEELHEMMEENTIIRGSNMWILIMAIFIASIGLNVDSTAVIIGAMLISPLMSGILTMGYALATSDLTLLRKAFTRFGTQVVISLITSTLYFRLTPLDAPTSEMIARTSPTLWDVLIALFGGIAGAIGNTRKKKGNVIPGVAIATALMPPLCTTGYGLATMQRPFILGAFYLFAINTLFIMLSAAFVMKLLGVPSHKAENPKRQKQVRRLITIITVLTVIPSVLVGGLKVYQSVMEQNFTSYLNNEFVFSDTQVVKSEIDLREREVSVSLVGSQIGNDVIERLEQKLSQYNLNNYTLHVTQNKVSQEDNSETVMIAVQEKTIQELQTQVEAQQEELSKMQTTLEEQVDCKKLSENAGKIFTKLSDCSCGVMSDANGSYILLCASASEPLLPEEEQAIKNWLVTESGLESAEIRVAEEG